MDNALRDDDQRGRAVSIDEAIDAVGIGRTQWMLLIITGLTFMSDAAEVTFLSFVTEQLRCEWGLTSGQETAVTQAVFIGMVLGAPVWGWLGDRMGRRGAFLLSSGIICSFGFGTAFCQGFLSLLLVRATVGFGVAGLPIGFDILCEALPTAGRGRFLLYIEYFWTAGSVFVTFIAWATLSTLGWQTFTILAALPTVAATVAGYFYLPESPRWLVDKGRLDEALVVINKWALGNGRKQGFSRLEAPPKTSRREMGTVREICSSRELRRSSALMTVVWLGFGISYYGTVSLLPRIFKHSGNSEVPFGATPPPTEAHHRCHVSFDFKDIGIAACAEVIGVMLAVQMVDSCGRSRTQLAFYSLGAVAAVVLGFRGMGFGALTVAASVARMAQMAACCCTWVHTPELFPTSVRAEAHEMLNLVSKIGATLAQFLISDAFSQITCACTMGAISLTAGLAAAGLKETAGMDLGNASDESSCSEGESGEETNSSLEG